MVGEEKSVGVYHIKKTSLFSGGRKIVRAESYCGKTFDPTLGEWVFQWQNWWNEIPDGVEVCPDCLESDDYAFYLLSSLDDE